MVMGLDGEMDGKRPGLERGYIERTYLEHIQDYHSPGTSDTQSTHSFQPAVEFRVVPGHNPAFAEEPHDSRTSVEGTKHDGAASILLDVADSLDAGTGGVDVGAQVRIEDGE